MNKTSADSLRASRSTDVRTASKPAHAGLRRRLLPASLMSLLGLAALGGEAFAGTPPIGAATSPTGGVVVGGVGSIVQRGASTVVNQQSKLLSLNWQTFNLGKDASVLFKQPSFTAVALNRILDQNPSQIFGHVSSNGQVFLINTHGIIFGSSAKLNVGGLVASTLDLTPADFLSSHFNLDAHGGRAGIVNHGTIEAASGGSVSLVGGQVENDGLIVANVGHINLDGADRAVLDFDGDGLINVQVTGALQRRLDADEAAVANKGTLQADGGTVVLQASAAKDLFTDLVNNSGVIDAHGISTDGGVVRLVAAGGNTVSSGDIDAGGTRGGTVQLLSDANVGVTGGRIDASGTQGGGRIRVGGGWQGGEGLQTAQATYVAPDASLHADATQRGQGGSVVVWGDRVDNFYGSITARGGAQGGDGGQVETSSHDGLNARGTVDASASHGAAGTWLLDPRDVEIVAGGTGTLSGGVFNAPADNSTIDPSVIDAALTGGTSVTVFTGSGGTQAGDITVTDPIAAAGAGTLYLKAAGSILLDAGIGGDGTDALNVNLWANYGGTAAATGYSSRATCGSCGVSVDAGIASTGGDVDIRTGDGSHAGGTVAFGAAGDVDTGGGNLSIASTGITQQVGSSLSAAAADLDTGTASATLAGANQIGTANLTGSGTAGFLLNDGSHAITLGTVSLGSGDLAVSAGGGITLSGNGIGTGGTQNYNDPVTLTGDTTLTGSTVTFFDGIAGSHALTVDGAGVFLGTSTLGSLHVTGASTVGASLTTTGTQTYDGAVTLGADTYLGGTTVTLAGGVQGSGDALTIDGDASLAGSSNLGSIDVTGTATLAGSVTTSGAQSYEGAVTLAGTTTLDSGDTVDFGGAIANDSSATPRTLSVTSTHGTTISGDVGVTNGGLGALTIDADTISVAGLDVGGDLSITTRDGGILQGGGWIVDGTSLFDAGGYAITLTSTANDFRHAVSLTGGTTKITDRNALTLGTLATGALTVSSGGALNLGSGLVGGNLQADTGGSNGAITQDTGTGKALDVTGTSILDAGAGAITLVNAGNDFVGAVSLTGSVVQIDDANALTLGALTTGTLTVSSGGALNVGSGLIGGNLSATVGGDVTQLSSAALTVTGTSDFNAGSHAITLAGAGNDFEGVVKLAGGSATINDKNALTLGTLNLGGTLTATSRGALNLGAGSVGGDLVATAGGGIDQAGALAVDGDATFTQDSTTAGASQDVDLDGYANTFGGNVGFAAGTGAQIHNLSLRNDDATPGTLTLPASVTGSVALDYANAALTVPAVGISGALDVTAGGGITIDGDVTTGAGQTYHGAVTLGADATLASTGGGAIDFTSTIDGAHNLKVNTGGLTTFGGAVGVMDALGSLTTDAAGRTTLDGSVSTTNGQMYNDAVSLGGNVVLESAGDAVIFGSTVDGAHALTVDTPSSGTVFEGDVGGATALTSLTLGAGGITELFGNVTTSGAQTYGHAVWLFGSTPQTLTGSAIDFASTLDGAQALTVNASGATTFGDAVGSGVALASLTTDAGGGTSLGGSVTTTGAQTYDDAVTLNGNATLTSTGSQAIDFASTVDGAHTLTVDTGGSTTFGGAVGHGTALASLTTDAGGTTTLSGDVTTSGTQAYGNAVNLAADATLTSGTGSVAFAGTVDNANATARALTVKAGGGVSFGGAVGGGANGALAKLTTNSGTFGAKALHIGAGGLSVTTTAGGIAQGSTQDDAFTVTGASTFDAGAHAITLSNAGNDFGGPVSLGNTGANDVALTNGGLLTLGNVSVGSGMLNLAGAGIAQATGTVVVQAANGGAATLDAGSGALALGNAGNDFTGTVTAGGAGVSIGDGNDLTVAGLADTGDGDVSLVAGGALTLPGAVDAGSGALTLDSGGLLSTGAALTGGNVSLTGAGGITLGGDVTAGGTLSLASTNQAIRQLAGMLDVTGVTTVNAGTGAITLNGADNDFGNVVNLAGGATQIVSSSALTLGTLDTGALTAISGGALNLGQGTVDGALDAEANGGIGQAGALTVNGASTFTQDSTTAGASQDIDLGGYANAFNGDVSFIAGPGAQIHDLSLRNTSTTPGALTLPAGITGDLTLDLARALALPAIAVDGALDVTAAGGITLSGDVDTGGAQTWRSAVTLAGDLTLTSTGNQGIGFASTVDGAHALTVDTGGITTFGGLVGHGTALTSLTTDAGGTTTLSGDVTTSGAQTYGDAVTLNDDATLTSTGGGAIGFASTVDGAHALTVDTGGTTTFGGLVGHGTALASLATDAGGGTTLSGDVTASGAQTYGDAVTLGGDATLTSTGNQGIGFASTVDGAHALTVDTGGITTFGGLVGHGTALTSLTTDAGGTITLSGDVTTSGTQTYGDAVTLGGDATLTSIGGGAIGFASTVDGAHALTVDTGGTTTFGGAVGHGTALASLTTDAGGGTTLSGDVATGGTQTYGDAVNLAADAALTSDTGSVAFAGTVDNANATARALTVKAAGGGVSFGGAVGGGANGALAKLTTNSRTFDAKALGIGAGGLSVTTTAGDIAQGGAFAVAGASTFDAGAHAITLSNAGNDFGGAVNLTGSHAAIVDRNALTLGTLDLSGALAATSHGALNLGSGDIGGALAATSNGGAIGQSGALRVGGAGQLNTGGGDIDVSNAGNDFAGTVDLVGDDAKIADRNALTLGTLDLSGALTATSHGALNLGGGSIGGALAAASNGGAIGQSGALRVGGAGQLDAGGGSLDLSNAGNDFVGAVTAGGHGVSLADRNDLTVAGLADSGNGKVSLTAAGQLKLPASGIDAGSGDLVLASNGGALATTGALRGGDVALTGKSGITLGGSVTASGTLSLASASGAIAEQGAGSLTAATLTGQAAGAATLAGANHVGTLGDFAASGFTLVNGQALTVGGTVDGGSGTSLHTTSGDLVLDGAVSGTTATLDAAGAIREGSGGSLAASTLTGRSGGSTTLDGSNRIGTLGDFSANGFSLADAQALIVAGTVDGGASVALTINGDLALDGAVKATDVALKSAGGISEGAGGSIVAGTLTGSSTGGTVLDPANMIDQLGDFSANGFSLLDGKALTVTGTVNGGPGVLLQTTQGGLTIDGTLEGELTTLQSAGTIVGGADGSIVAHTLTGGAAGATTLGTARQAMDNHVDILGGFDSPSGFSFTDSQTLTLASVNGSGYTVNAGQADLYLGVTGGDLLQNGTNWLYDGAGTWSSTGHIGLATAPIYVMGVANQVVSEVGLPPAYFYAVDVQGNILPLIGAPSVNVPTSVLTSRSQNANGHGDAYIDASVITANYRSFGIVPSGILLPPDQQDCQPGQPSSPDCPDDE